MKEKFYFLIEWAIWGHLYAHNDLELILLKGHLLIEITLSSTLSNFDIEGNTNFSFHRKVITLSEVNTSQTEKLNKLVYSLKALNKLRNKLAHEFHYDTDDGELELWAKQVLSSFQGTKYTNYTHRTKIVQAFSTLGGNLYEFGESSDRDICQNKS